MSLPTFGAETLCPLISRLTADVARLALRRRIQAVGSGSLPLGLVMARMAKSDTIRGIATQGGELTPGLDMVHLDLDAVSAAMLAGVAIALKDSGHEGKVLGRLVVPLALSPVSATPDAGAWPDEVAPGAVYGATGAVSCENRRGDVKDLAALRTRSLAPTTQSGALGAPLALASHWATARRAGIGLDPQGCAIAGGTE